MGCDDYPILGNRYQITGGPVAIQWNDALAQQFPDADHNGCLQSMTFDGDQWHTHNPPLCHGYHCPNCGAACGMIGHRKCQT